MTGFALMRHPVPTGLSVGGSQTPAANGATFDVIDPATGCAFAAVADAGAADAMRALDAAVDAQDEWTATPPRHRSAILRRAWELLTARAADVALVITMEMGKTLPESRSEIAYGAEYLRWFSEEAVRIEGRYTQSPSGGGRILVSKVPVGPCLAITPWNFPLAMGTRKIGPALAAGCTMIVKPAALTPLTMLMLAEIFTEAGLPDGVLSVLPSSHAATVTDPLLADPRLRKVTFTGSTQIGKILIERSAHQVLRTSMELGGNAPFIVFDDADLDAALDGVMAAKIRNGGEACTAANRLLLAEPIREEFTARLSTRIAALKVGPGTTPGVDVGPLVSAKQRAAVAELVDDAVAAGARVRTGGSAIDEPGFFYQPTVLDRIPPGARITTEEIFGPVAAITAFDDEAEAITAANDTEYGLAAYLFTQNLDRAMRVADALDAGMVGVNRGVVSDVAAPFGGVKHSGLGREGGREGIEEYLDTKYIAFTA